MTTHQFTSTHQYYLGDDSQGKVGITPFAQEQLGDVVFVELPALGRVLAAGELVGTIESVKTASEYFSPISGTVVAVNQAVSADSSLINTAPLAEGWLFEIKPAAPVERAKLLNEADYLKDIS